MTKKILPLLLAFSLMLGFAACEDKEPVVPTPSPLVEESPTPSVSNQQEPIGTGTITRTEDSKNGTVTLEAFPAEDCGFIGWASDESGKTMVSYYNPYTFDATKEITLYPVFMHNEQIIEFQDSVVESAVQFHLKTSTITYADLQQISNLTVYYPEVLADFAYLHELKCLSIYLTPATDYDLAPFANLINIESLSIYDASVDVLPVENYKNLKELRLCYSGEDTSPLIQSMNTLEILELDTPNIQDYTFLTQFTKLKTFCISNISSIECILTCLPNSLEGLSISNCTGTNGLKDLAKFVNLKNLWISNSSFMEEALPYFPNSLENLYINNCMDFKNLKALSKLINLTTLSINACWISDITPIDNLSNLKALYLNNNLISNLSPLAKLQKLEVLELKNNRITSLSPLEPLCSQNLFYVNVDFNPITDYSLFKAMPGYSSYYNEITHALSIAQNMVDNLIKPEMTVEEKYFALASGLCEKVTSIGGNTAYEALALEKANPLAYTEAYMMLCSLADLPCYYVSGELNEIAHSWNIVKIGNYYYHIDISCMDALPSIDKTYFLKSDKFFQRHSHTNFSTPTFVCNDFSKDSL